MIRNDSFAPRIALIGLALLQATSAAAEEFDVGVSSFVFTPSQLTIKVGDTVTWTNTGGFHNVVANDGSFTSGPASSAEWTYSFTFDTPGVFGYFCVVHIGVGMSGIITVEAVGSPPQALANNDFSAIDDDDDGSETVQLDGSGSSDPDNNIDTYEWLENDQVIANGVSPMVNLDVGIHSIVLRVTDTDGLEDEDNLVVVVFEKEQFFVAGMSDANGNSSPDFAASFLNSGSSSAEVVVKDSLSGNTINTLSLGAVTLHAIGTSSDLDNSGSPEVVALVVDFDGNVSAQVLDAQTGNVIKVVSYPPSFPPVAMTIIENADGNGATGIAVLGVNAQGDVRVRVKNALTGALISTIQFAPNFPPKFMDTITDVSGNNIPEIAVLGIDAQGNIRAQLKDVSTGTLIHWIQFARAFGADAFVSIPDAGTGGGPALGVLGVHADGRVRLQVKDAASRTTVNRVSFAMAYAPLAALVLPDSNNNGVSELVVIGISGELIRAQIKDAMSKALVGQVFFAKTFPLQAAAMLLDADNNNIGEIMVYGLKANGVHRVQIKDSSTASQVGAIIVP